MIKKNFWLSLVLTVLFVFSQTAGLLHAEIHPFHEHTEECDVYEQLAKPTSSNSDVVLQVMTSEGSSLITVSVPSDPEVVLIPMFWGRAPPTV
ncbi:MAG: hypothetical protein U9N57_05320 [Pseudomonadota bacterium]|nr:hypothetical protein [Pseudomonadota bacterium]